MKIAFVTPELDPLVRRTQVAELSQALPRALKDAGSDVRVFLPWTKPIQLGGLVDLTECGAVTVRDVDRVAVFTLYRCVNGQVPVYLFENTQLFAERNPYGGDEGPYSDNWRRYAAFARAVLASFPVLDFDPDVLHCVDWTMGMIPVLRELEFAKEESHPASRVGIYFQIHNLATQGTFEREILPQIGIPHRMFQSVGGVELGGKVNFLKSGAEFATILGTNSPHHAQRIQQQDRGYGLEDVFRRRHKELVGIASGIDYNAWDPSNDPLLPQAFSAKDKDLAGKRKCKSALQAALNLDRGPRTPLAAMIGRFDTDSGFDLLAEVLTGVLERNIEVVLMGAGRPDIQERLKTMETTFTGRCRVIEGYQPNLAHQIMGGADILLLPSHYHPGNALCAIGMRYGVVPIVYGGSGLEDYVVDLDASARNGTGFHFQTYSGEGLLAGIDRARKLYRNAVAWKTLVMRCLRQDFSWQATAQEYLKAYRRVTRRVRTPQQKTA